MGPSSFFETGDYDQKGFAAHLRNKKHMLSALAMVLLIVGGLNWGLYRFTGNNLVEMVGSYTHEHIATALYVLVTLAAVWVLGVKFTHM